MKICESCGLPMEGAKVRTVNGQAGDYCIYCTEASGSLRKRDEVRESVIKYMVKFDKKTREEAEKLVDGHLEQMPAWSKKQ